MQYECALSVRATQGRTGWARKVADGSEGAGRRTSRSRCIARANKGIGRRRHHQPLHGFSSPIHPIPPPSFSLLPGPSVDPCRRDGGLATGNESTGNHAHSDTPRAAVDGGDASAEAATAKGGGRGGKQRQTAKERGGVASEIAAAVCSRPAPLYVFASPADASGGLPGAPAPGALSAGVGSGGAMASRTTPTMMHSIPAQFLGEVTDKRTGIGEKRSCAQTLPQHSSRSLGCSTWSHVAEIHGALVEEDVREKQIHQRIATADRIVGSCGQAHTPTETNRKHTHTRKETDNRKNADREVRQRKATCRAKESAATPPGRVMRCDERCVRACDTAYQSCYPPTICTRRVATMMR